jgi:hypothetical protein
MSEQNPAPGRADADDVAGHVNYRGSGEQPKVDDAEGHLFRRGDDDDTEGHVRGRGDDDRDDTEGHVRGRSDDDGDDVEGHHFRQ